MENVITDFVRIFCAIAKLSLEKRRLGTRPGLLSILSFSQKFLFPKIFSLKSFDNTWRKSPFRFLAMII